MAKRAYIGGLYEFRIGDRYVCGLCTHEVVEGFSPHLGQLIRLCRGPSLAPLTESEPLSHGEVLTSLFVNLPRMLRAKDARHLGQQDIPADFQDPVRLRHGGGDLGEFFLTEGLGDAQRVLDDDVPETVIRATPDEAVADITALRDVYRFDLTPERSFDIKTRRLVIDRERDALF